MRANKRLVGFVVLILAAVTPRASAEVSVSFDADTLNMMLRAASTQDVEIPISNERTLLVQLRDVRLLKLDPAAEGKGGRGYLRTAVELSIPEFDLDLSLKPTVVLDVVKGEQFNELEMRFAELKIPVPILGEFDIAPFLHPLRYPAEDLWYLAGARGIVHLRSHLVDITMGQRAIRFDFELELTTP
jgi:hypothetical protein